MSIKSVGPKPLDDDDDDDEAIARAADWGAKCYDRARIERWLISKDDRSIQGMVFGYMMFEEDLINYSYIWEWL